MPFELFRLAIAERKQVICIYKGYYREVCPHVLGWKAATHRSWFINLAVEVPPACRPAASGGGWTFGKCKMSGFEMGHGIRDKAINSRNPASIGSR